VNRGINRSILVDRSIPIGYAELGNMASVRVDDDLSSLWQHIMTIKEVEDAQAIASILKYAVHDPRRRYADAPKEDRLRFLRILKQDDEGVFLLGNMVKARLILKFFDDFVHVYPDEVQHGPILTSMMICANLLHQPHDPRIEFVINTRMDISIHDVYVPPQAPSLVDDLDVFFKKKKLEEDVMLPSHESIWIMAKRWFKNVLLKA
jgi:hypothetical protein